MIGFAGMIGVATLAGVGGGGGGGGSPFLSSIDAVGWSGQAAAPGSLPAYSTGDTEFTPDTAPIYVGRTRAGYDNTGAVTSFSEPLIVTRRVRQTYTTSGAATHLLGSTATCALDTTTFSTDTTPGCTNNSTVTSPKPVAQWLRRNRRVCGNTLRVELHAYQMSGKGGKPIACAKVQATNGVTPTATVTMTGPVILTSATDRYPVIGYYADIDTSGYADGTVLTVNGQVYPRIGGPASVLDSTGGTQDGRGFTPQTYYKHAAKVANPPYVYVDSSGGGVDVVVLSTGITAGGITKVSTTAATARANPFATFASAFNALKAATGVTGGLTDGCIARAMAGTHALNALPGAGTYQTAGEVIIEADPLASAGTVILSTPGGLRQSYMTLHNVAIVRPAATQWGLTRFALENVTVDQNGQTNAIANGVFWVNGLVFNGDQNAIGGALLPVAGGVYLVRGVQGGQIASTGAAFQVDGLNVAGCDFKNAKFDDATRGYSGGILASYSNMGCTAPVLSFSVGTIDGYAKINFIDEYSSTVSGTTVRPSGDAAAASVYHFMEWSGTYAGADIFGRHNAGYDETPSVYRQHKNWSRRGVIYVAYYEKCDWFLGVDGNGTPNPTDAPNHTGSWSVMYGVDSQGCLFQFPVNSGADPSGLHINGDRSPAFFGMGAKRSSTTYTRLDPKYATGATALGKATTVSNVGVATAGTGGAANNYLLDPTSPAKGMVADAGVPFDLFGNTRLTTLDAAGAAA